MMPPPLNDERFYEKKLQYPVKVSKYDSRLAKYLIEQYGGSDRELAAALRYLNQRYTIPEKVIGLLTDIGTEEFARLEMIATMVYKLTKDATPEQLKQAGLGEHYANHGMSLFYHNAGGSPFRRSRRCFRVCPYGNKVKIQSFPEGPLTR